MDGRLLLTAAAACAAACLAAQPVHGVDAGEPFGDLPLVDEVNCGDQGDSHPFEESRPGVTRVETILGRPCRVMVTGRTPRYFAYRIGEGKDLRGGKAYVLSVEYPEDKPRSMFIANRGAESSLGLHTGVALGDVLHGHQAESNPESVQLPLAGRHRAWRTLFFLHDRFAGLKMPQGGGGRPFLPIAGFWVLFSQSTRVNHPLSAGAAVSRVRLFEVPDPDRFTLRMRLPPPDLPRRHLFWREDSLDAVVRGQTPEERGVLNETDWFEHRVRLMKFLGFNTFARDVLALGYNRGWDSEPFGGEDWVFPHARPQRWPDILWMLQKHDVGVLPYFEYAGSIGRASLGRERRCVTLGGGRTYTHLGWSEKANADLTDPDTLADARKILEATLVRYKDQARFIGAWFRTRPTNLPMSFSDPCLARFAAEANGGAAVTRDALQADAGLLQRYYQWWFGKRRAFLVGLRDTLREKIDPSAVVLFTAEASAGGPSLRGDSPRLVTDDVPGWTAVLKSAVHRRMSAVAFDDVVGHGGHLEALTTPRPTQGNWEWQHSVPHPDPANYRATDGVLMTYAFNRLYTVASPRAFDAFRTPSGLAIIRHSFSNEGEPGGDLGHFTADVERTGPLCMLAEVRAVAYGDPRFIGYLSSNAFNRGSPEYVRSFNSAFLSLPALPSRLLTGVCDDADIVVRSIDAGEHGTYFAVVNLGLRAKANVAVRLPGSGEVRNAPSGRVLAAPGGEVGLSFHACQLRALHMP